MSLEAFQNTFLSFIFCRCNVNRGDPQTSYFNILGILLLDSLELRRVKFDLCFWIKVVHNNIDCPDS